jgi:hypothetical protein
MPHEIGMTDRKVITGALLALGVLLHPATALAADSRPPAWYEVATGVIAIPVALIGMAYSFYLIQKTRLEVRKTELESRKAELEIAEKERQLASVITGPVASTAVVAPAFENRLVLMLLLRFVVLYVILAAWGLFEDVFDLMFTGAVVGFQQLLSLELSGWSAIPFVVVQKLPKLAYWLVFFSLAGPLFRDVNAALGIDVKQFFALSSLRALRGDGTDKDG